VESWQLDFLVFSGYGILLSGMTGEIYISLFNVTCPGCDSQKKYFSPGWAFIPGKVNKNRIEKTELKVCLFTTFK